MPQQTTMWEELTAAAQGVVALVTGNRKAPSYFDFSQRGLAGSFIVLLMVIAVDALAPMFDGPKNAPGAAAVVIENAIVIVLTIGVSALILRWLKRLDSLVPLIVVSNWSLLFATIVAILLMTLGVDFRFAGLIVSVLVIVLAINTARLIMTLTPLQIVIFIVGQGAGVLIGLVLLSMFFPDPPAGAAAVSNLPG